MILWLVAAATLTLTKHRRLIEMPERVSRARAIYAV